MKFYNHRGGRPKGKDVCLEPADNLSVPVSPTLARATKGHELKPQEAHADTIKEQNKEREKNGM